MAIDRLVGLRATGLALVALALCPTGQTDTIYRCETETGVIFSDRPCGEQARTYTPSNSLSVVPANQRLAEIEAENQAFQQREAEQRRQRRDARRAAGSQPQARPPMNPHPAPSGQIAAGIRVVPEWIQQDRRLQADDRPTRRPERISRDEPPYSALSGRLPGTRRETESLPERQRPQRNPP